MEFFISMIPPTVTHHSKELHAFIRNGKPVAVLHDSMELKDARNKLHAYLAPYKPSAPMCGAIRLCVKWCFPLSGTHKNGEYRTSKPDTDNLQKVLKDTMTSLHFWKDDAQVVSEIVEKFWACVPGIFISVNELTEE